MTMSTRAANKDAHPGHVVRLPATRRSTAQVDADRATTAAKKEATKEAKRTAREKSVNKVAAFEQQDQMMEDSLAVTPRPTFASKQRRATSSEVEETSQEPSSDIDMSVGDKANDDFIPKPTDALDGSVTEEYTGDEDEVVAPLPKKIKVAAVNNATKDKAKATEQPKSNGKKAKPLRVAISAAKAVSSSNKHVEANAASVDVDAVEWLDDGGFRTPSPKRHSAIEVAGTRGEKAKARSSRGVSTKHATSNSEGVNSTSLGLKQGNGGRGVAESQRKNTDVKDKGKMSATAAAPASKPRRSHQNVVDGHVDDSSESEIEIVKPRTKTLEDGTRKRKHGADVHNWAKSIPHSSKLAGPPETIRTVKSMRSVKSSSKSGSTLGGTSAVSSGPTIRTTPSVLTSHMSILSQPKPEIKPEPQDHSIVYISDGGLSDDDERKGAERDAAVKSPRKGKVRATSLHLLTEIPARRGDPNGGGGDDDDDDVEAIDTGDAPTAMDSKIFRRNYCTTYMRFVSQQRNPWDIPARLACAVMQLIFDAVFCGFTYRFTPTSYLYKKTLQRVSDRYRHTIGSAGLAIVLAFLNANDDTRDSDEERQAFATNYLADRRFLYKKAEGDNPAKFKGLLEGPFVIQAFAQHFTAVSGAQKISGLDDPDYAVTKPLGGLALAAVSIERALTLIANGTITVDMKPAKNGVPILPKELNLATGKMSNVTTAFNEGGWGTATRAYSHSIKLSFANRQDKFEAICRKAIQLSKQTNTSAQESDIVDLTIDDGALDERAMLVYISDSSESDSE